jgi:hypothetical protein
MAMVMSHAGLSGLTGGGAHPIPGPRLLGVEGGVVMRVRSRALVAQPAAPPRRRLRACQLVEDRQGAVPGPARPGRVALVGQDHADAVEARASQGRRPRPRNARRLHSRQPATSSRRPWRRRTSPRSHRTSASPLRQPSSGIPPGSLPVGSWRHRTDPAAGQFRPGSTGSVAPHAGCRSPGTRPGSAPGGSWPPRTGIEPHRDRPSCRAGGPVRRSRPSGGPPPAPSCGCAASHPSGHEPQRNWPVGAVQPAGQSGAELAAHVGHGGLLEGAGLLEVELLELQAVQVAVLPAAHHGLRDHHRVDPSAAQVLLGQARSSTVRSARNTRSPACRCGQATGRDGTGRLGWLDGRST